MTTKSTARKNPVLRLVGCLIKVPLGCLGFIMGGVAMGLLFLPPSLGKLLHDKIERGFNENFTGSLELDELWIGSIYNDQRIEGIELRDPQGELVLSGALRAPDLWKLEFGEADSWGPVSIKLDKLYLTQDASGETNLERALTCDGELSKKSEHIKESLLRNLRKLNADLTRTVTIEFSIDRLRWQRAGHEPLMFEDLVFAVDLRSDGWARRLDGKGQVHVAGKSGKPLSFQWHVDNLMQYDDSAWRIVLGGEQVPIEMLRELFGELGGIASLVGAEVDTLSLKFFGENQAQSQIEVLLENDGSQLSLRADLDREKQALVARGKEQWASLSLPRNSALAELALQSAVPLGEGFEMGENSEALWMHFRDFELPLDGDFERLQANCTFEARDVSFAYQQGLRKRFQLHSRERIEEELHLSLRNGVLIYDGLSLPAKAAIIQLDGGLNLSDGQRHLVIRYKHFPDMKLEGPRVLGAWADARD